MRKLEYRFWDVEVCKMRYFNELFKYDNQDVCIVGVGPREIFIQKDGHIFTVEDKRFVPMLSTNEGDKNGKEVFEFDIIYSPVTQKTHLVEWKSHLGCCCDDMVGFFLHEGNRSDRVIEIIGNKFENKDLLKSIQICYQV